MSRHDVPQLSRAHAQMTEALRILDGLDAPGEVGAHLDLAIVSLEKELGIDTRGTASFEELLARFVEEPAAADAGPRDLTTAWDVRPA